MINNDNIFKNDTNPFMLTLITENITKNEAILNILFKNEITSSLHINKNNYFFVKCYEIITSEQQNALSKCFQLKKLLHYNSYFLSNLKFNKENFILCIINIYKNIYINIYNEQNIPDMKLTINYINDIILRLYNGNILTLRDINVFLLILLVLCIFKVNKNNLQSSNNTNIKNDIMFTLAFEFLFNLSKNIQNEESIEKFLSFFYKEFIQHNYNNQFHLTTEAYHKDIFDIWKIILLLYHNGPKSTNISNTIINIFISIYKERFTQWNAMHNIINLTKTFLINFNKQPIYEIINNLFRNCVLSKIIDSIIHKDNDLARYDELYKPSLSFYFGGNVNNYISWNAGVLPKSELVIVFSFRLTDNTKQSYGIMSILAKNIKYINIYLSKDNNSNCFKFIIDYKRSKHSKIIQTDDVIKVNQTYLFVISFNSKETKIFYKTTRYYNYKCISEKIHPDLKSQKLTFYLGKNEIVNDDNNIFPFMGFIGPVIGLLKVDNDFIKNIFALKGKYYYFLYLKTCDFKYMNFGKISSKEEEDAFIYFKEQKTNILENILVFITDPWAFESVIPCNKYKQIQNKQNFQMEIIPNIYEFKKLTFLRGQKSISYSNHFNQTFSTYKISNVLLTFLECNGLKYISLQFEYCYQILLISKNTQIIIEIIDNVNILLQLIKNIIKNIKIDLYINDIDQIYYQMTKVINRISDLGYSIGIFLDNLFQIFTVYIEPDYDTTSKSKKEKKKLNYKLQIFRSFCELFFNVEYYQQKINCCTRDRHNFSEIDTINVLAAILLNISVIIKNQNKIITPKLFHKYSQLVEYIITTKEISSNLIESYKSLFANFFSSNISTFTGKEHKSSSKEENSTKKTIYADLLLNNCLTFLSNSYDYKHPIQSTEHINVLLQLFFDKETNLKNYVSQKHIEKFRELFGFIYGDNVSYIDNEHHAKTFQLMLYLLLLFFKENTEEIENYFMKYNFIHTNLFFDTLILFLIKFDDLQSKLIYDINIQNRIELEGLDNKLIYSLFNIACEILLKGIEDTNQQEEISICVHSYKLIKQFINNLLPLEESDALRKKFFSKGSCLSNIYSKFLSLSSSDNEEENNYIDTIKDDFCNIAKITFFIYDDLFLIDAIYECIKNYFSENENHISDTFFGFIESVHSLYKEHNFDKKSNIYYLNLIELLQKISILFANPKIANNIIKHRNNVIELCHFFETFKLLNLFSSKIGLKINEEYKIIAEIAFDLLITCYLQFQDEVIINTIGYILHIVNDQKDDNQIKPENIWINLDKLNSNKNQKDELDFLSIENHPKINDINLSITFIIKVYKLIKQQTFHNKRLVEYLTSLYDETIELLFQQNQKTFFSISKNKLYNDIVNLFEESRQSKLKLRDFKENLHDIFEKYEDKKEITNEEYNCFKISKSAKINHENDKYNRSASNDCPQLINNNILSTPPLRTKKRERLLSENIKRVHSSTNTGKFVLLYDNESNDKSNCILGEQESTFVNNKDHPKSVKNCQKLTNVSKQQKYIYKHLFCNEDENIEEKDNEYSFELIEKHKTLFSAKKEILLSYFSLQFKDIYFYNEDFVKMKSAFRFDDSSNIKFKLLNYPSKIKHFSDSLHPSPFLKIANTFFDDKFFPVSHSYINNKNICDFKTIPFKKRFQSQIEKENSFECEIIAFEYSLYGKLRIYKNYLEFESDVENDPRKQKQKPFTVRYMFSSIQNNNVHKYKHILIYYSEIKELIIKRFLYMYKAFEIFLDNGKTYFIDFFSEKTCKEFLDSIKIKLLPKTIFIDSLESLKEQIKKYKSDWESDKISTFDYLLYLNKYASRSFKDGNQYPVFPWLLKDYSNLLNPYFGLVQHDKQRKCNQKYECIINREYTKIEQEDKLYRKMEYPISLQTQSKRKTVISRFKEMIEFKKFGYHLGNHYSTCSFVLYYLMRILPFTNLMIVLQNGGLESPNRMLISLHLTQTILKKSNDNRELIPEIFSNIHYMLNLNFCYFGKSTSLDLVNHFRLITEDTKELYTPQHIGTYVQYLLMHNKLLNSPKIKNQIIKWIDYTFGIKQFDTNENSCLIFHKNSYEQKTNLLEKYGRLKKKYSNYKEIEQRLQHKIHMILNFGQTPSLIIDSAHDLNIHSAQENDKNKEAFDKNELQKPTNKEINNSNLIYCKAHHNELILISNKGEIIIKNSNQNFQIYNTQLNIINISTIEQTFIVLNKHNLIISVNYPDSSIRFYDRIKNSYLNRYILDDYITSICQFSEDEFLTGNKHGQLKLWKCQYINSQISLHPKRFIYAHTSDITSIQLNKILNVIITAGNDNYIYIRKAYDFELLSEMHISESYLQILSFKYSLLNLLYVMCYNERSKENVIIGFTFSGIEFARSEESVFSNIEITKSGNLIVNDIKNKKIRILKGGELTELGCFQIKNLNDKQIKWISFDYHYKSKVMYVIVDDDTNNLKNGINIEEFTEEYILFD